MEVGAERAGVREICRHDWQDFLRDEMKVGEEVLCPGMDRPLPTPLYTCGRDG